MSKTAEALTWVEEGDLCSQVLKLGAIASGAGIGNRSPKMA